MHRGNPPLNGVKYIATTWASRIPRMDTETCATDIPGYIVPSEAQITYYKTTRVNQTLSIESADSQSFPVCTPSIRDNTTDYVHTDGDDGSELSTDSSINVSARLRFTDLSSVSIGFVAMEKMGRLLSIKIREDGIDTVQIVLKVIL